MCVGPLHLIDTCGKCPAQFTENLTFRIMYLLHITNFKSLGLLAQMQPLCLAVMSETVVTLNPVLLLLRLW